MNTEALPLHLSEYIPLRNRNFLIEKISVGIYHICWHVAGTFLEVLDAVMEQWLTWTVFLIDSHTPESISPNLSPSIWARSPTA